MKTLWKKLSLGVAFIAASGPAIALADGTGAFDLNRALTGLGATLVYGLVGIALCVLAYKVLEWTTPFSIRKELEEDHNTAVAIVIGAMMLGVSLIIAATILS